MSGFFDLVDVQKNETAYILQGLSDEQIEMQQDMVGMVRDFMKKEIEPHVLEWEEKGDGYPQEVIQKGIDMGLHMMQVPEEYGGFGLTTTTTAMMIQEGAHVESTYMGMFNVTSMGGKVVMKAGTEEQKRFYADILQKGTISAFCLTEAGCGSDAAAVRTKAEKKGHSYVINGTKMFITNANLAGVFLVVASLDYAKGAKGLATFIVEADRPGVSVSNHFDKMSSRLSNTAEVIFEDVEVPEDHLIGSEEAGFKNAMNVLTASRPIIAASALGMSELARDLSLQYSKERVAFGKPISQHQLIQEKLARMEVLIHAMRGLVYNCTMKLDAGQNVTREAAIAKLFCTDAANEIVDEAVQVYGGYGVMNEYLIQKLYRDARTMKIVEGTNEIQKTIIARDMLR